MTEIEIRTKKTLSSLVFQRFFFFFSCGTEPWGDFLSLLKSRGSLSPLRSFSSAYRGQNSILREGPGHSRQNTPGWLPRIRAAGPLRGGSGKRPELLVAPSLNSWHHSHSLWKLTSVTRYNELAISSFFHCWSLLGSFARLADPLLFPRTAGPPPSHWDQGAGTVRGGGEGREPGPASTLLFPAGIRA